MVAILAAFPAETFLAPDVLESIVNYTSIKRRPRRWPEAAFEGKVGWRYLLTL